MTAPYAPTIVAPQDGADQNLTLAFPIQFIYNPAPGSGALSAWSLAIANAGSGYLYSYWDAATASWGTAGGAAVWNAASLLTLNADGSWTYPFPAASWTQATWTWQLATQEATIGDESAATTQTIVGAVQPTATLAAPPTTSATPTYSWTFSPGSGGTQVSWELDVYEQSVAATLGFEPGVTTPLWSASGTGATASVVQEPGVLVNGDALVAYCQLGELVGTATILSPYVSQAWTVAFTGPLAPTVTAVGTADLSTGAPQIKVDVTAAATGLAPTWAHIEYSDDGETWYDLAAHVSLTAGHVEVLDPLVRPGVERTYRAAVVGAVSGVNYASPWSTATAAANMNMWVLLDPANPAGAVAFHLSANPTFTVSEQSTRYYPLGRPTGVKATDSPKGKGASLAARINSYAEQAKLETLLLSTGILYLISPYDAWPISLDGNRSPSILYTTTALATPFFDTTFGYVEADISSPAGGRAP